MHAFEMIEEMDKCTGDTFLQGYSDQIHKALELEEKELLELLTYLYERMHEETGLIKTMFADFLILTVRKYPEKLKNSIFHDAEDAIRINEKAN